MHLYVCTDIWVHADVVISWISSKCPDVARALYSRLILFSDSIRLKSSFNESGEKYLTRFYHHPRAPKVLRETFLLLLSTTHKLNL